MTLLVFDMDGTIADLYNVPDWLRKLRSEDASPYAEAQPMWDMDSLVETLNALRATGDYEVAVVTWCALDSSAPYRLRTRWAKMRWLREYDFPCDHFHCVQYGTTKANCVRNKADSAILFDDNAQVRNGWHLGDTVDPAVTNLIDFLKGLLEG